VTQDHANPRAGTLQWLIGLHRRGIPPYISGILAACFFQTSCGRRPITSLIPLYFIGHGLLEKPSLYLSDFFERHRASYYDALMRVRVSNDMIHWVRFFLTGVAETAERGKTTFQKILALRGEVEHALFGMGRRARNGKELLILLYRRPFVTASEVSSELDISIPTANTLIREFVEMGVLKQVAGAERNRVFAFERYFGLFLS
jgi:Fic family protein